MTLLNSMEKRNIPITRENYLREAYGCIPEEWDSEMESLLPEELMDWDALSKSLDLGKEPCALPSRQ